MPQKILVIDDEVDMLFLLRTIIENHTDYEVETTNSPSEGIKLMKENDFHLVVTDLKMPGLDGIDLFDEFKEMMESGAVSKQPVQTERTKVVQTAVQTPSVQTGILGKLKSLTPTERNLVWSMVNTDLKLSYEDVSVILGRDKSTVRGLMNNVKRKYEDLISESTEESGKKRFFVEDSVKNEIMKGFKEAQKTKRSLFKTQKVSDYIG